MLEVVMYYNRFYNSIDINTMEGMEKDRSLSMAQIFEWLFNHI